MCENWWSCGNSGIVFQLLLVGIFYSCIRNLFKKDVALNVWLLKFLLLKYFDRFTLCILILGWSGQKKSKIIVNFKESLKDAGHISQYYILGILISTVVLKQVYFEESNFYLIALFMQIE